MLRDAAAQGQQLSALSRPFEALQGGADRAAETLGKMRTATRGLVSEVALLEAANKAQLLGLTDLGLDLGDLAGVATTLGRAMGQGAAKSVDDLTTALGRQSPMILDNLGISVSLEKANASYAATLGKTADALTEKERKLAFVTAAMTAAREKASQLGETELTVADHATRVTTAYGDLLARLGASANESGVLSGALELLGDRYVGVIDEGEQLLTVLDRIRRDMGESTPGIEREADAYDRLAAAVTAFGAARAREGLGYLVAPGATGAALWLRGARGAADLARGAYVAGEFAAGAPHLPTPGRDINLGQSEFERVMAISQAGDEAARRLHVSAQTALERMGDTAAREREAAAGRWQQEIAKLTGRETIAGAEQLAKQLSEIGKAGDRIPTNQVATLADRLIAARDAAREAGDAISTGLTREINRLTGSPAYEAAFRAHNAPFNRILNPPSSLAGITGGDLWRLTAGTPGTFLPSTNPFNVVHLQGAVAPIQKAKKETRDWAAAAQDVAQAFGTLSQITGGKLDPISQLLGNVSGSMNAGMSLTRGLGLSGAGGGALAAGVGAGTLGFNLGQGLGRVGGTLAGAGGGAAMGTMIGTKVFPGLGTGAGAAIGAGIGGVSGYFGARAAESQLRKLKDLQANELVAQYGDLDALLETVGRLGLSPQTFLERFYGEPREFAKGVGDLTTALTRERTESDKLATSLQSVSQARGVLSPAQLQQVRGVRAGSPGQDTILAFQAEQRQETEAGLAQAVNALAAASSLSEAELEEVTRGLETAEQKEAAITAALARKGQDVLTRFGAGARAAAVGLHSAFAEALEQGEDALSAVRRFEPYVTPLRELFARAGQAVPGFGQLESYTRIAAAPGANTALDVASGLGRAAAATQNQGLMSPELFADFAAGISESYYQLERLGQGGVDATRLMQPGLQTIWQLMTDFGYEVDDSTQTLIDFALQSGVIGDKFRPAADRMVGLLEKIVDRVETLLDRLTAVSGWQAPAIPEWPTGGTGGGTTYQAPDGTTVQVPGAKAGGLVTRPTVLMAGEDGPEAIIPLSRLHASGASEQTIVVQIGREVLLRTTVQGMPGYLTVRGLA